MRQCLAAVACFGLATALLVWQYPWSVFYDRFLFTASETILSYVVTALLMVATCVCSHYAITFIATKSRRATWALSSGFALVALWIIGVVLGPGGLNIPGTRVRGMFFDEWNFIGFLVLVVPYSLAASAIVLWAHQQRQPTDIDAA